MKSSWYKEPWAWLVFILPLSAVVAGITTLIIANTDADPLVVGDYYKKGKAINVELSKVKLAQKLGIRFQLKAADGEIVLRPTGIEKKFAMVNAHFYHATQEHKDFTVALTPDANGNLRASVENELDGKWRITITTFNAEWKIDNKVSLPQSGFIAFEPDLSEAN